MLIAVAGIISATAFGKPARREAVSVMQPDGTEVTIIKRGDAHCNSVFTSDGYLLMRDAGLGYVYAMPGEGGMPVASTVRAHDAASRTEEELDFIGRLSPDFVNEALAYKMSHARKTRLSTLPAFAERNEGMKRGPIRLDTSFPSTGKQKALVILVEFKDVRFNQMNKTEFSRVDAHTYFSEMLNKPGFDTYGATGSAYDWFVANSGGRFEPEFDVVGPVTLPNTVSYYGQNDPWGNDLRAYEMTVEACKALDDQIDYREYDRDGDGYVDNVFLYYAGYGEADTQDRYPETIWPHSWDLTESPLKAPLELDGVKINHYACANETCGVVAVVNGRPIFANRPDGIGTFVHEFSHVLGLPDLYQTRVYDDQVPFTPGEYSVLDYGPYNNDGLTPPNYSAFERYALGWLEPSPISVSGNYEIENLAESNKAYIIQTDNENEFFLLENRQQTGWDEYLPGHGMLVWHVDFDDEKFNGNDVNNIKDHQHVDLVEADNIQDNNTLDGDPFPGYNNVRSFGFHTTPSLRSWSGKNTWRELTGISEADGKITFRAEVDKSAVTEIAGEEGILSGEIYDLSGCHRGTVTDGNMPALAPGMYIVKGENGARKIVVGK